MPQTHLPGAKAEANFGDMPVRLAGEMTKRANGPVRLASASHSPGQAARPVQDLRQGLTTLVPGTKRAIVESGHRAREDSP